MRRKRNDSVDELTDNFNAYNDCNGAISRKVLVRNCYYHPTTNVVPQTGLSVEQLDPDVDFVRDRSSGHGMDMVGRRPVNTQIVHSRIRRATCVRSRKRP
jgi:hypothetical protein